MNLRCRVLAATFILGAPAAAFTQVPRSSAEIFRAWCARCHGEDGSGRVTNPTVKTLPMSFSDCRVATPEPDADWTLVIARGGAAAGLSAEMPAFGDSLTEQQVKELVVYLRTFCRESGWPHGNLNIPRAVFTEKAFPENEVVILPVVSHRSGEYVRFRLESVYETRFGRRGHGEIGVPVETVGWPAGRAFGVGDLSIAGKYVVYADRLARAIVTGGLEIRLPTGSRTWGFGEGTPVFEPFVASGAIWRDVYWQVELKLELPVRGEPGEDSRHVVYNGYAGRDLSAVPNTWTIGIEVNGVDQFLALTPQIRKGLTRTGALAAAGGVRIPVVNRHYQQYTRWAGYLLWEYLEPVRARR